MQKEEGTNPRASPHWVAGSGCEQKAPREHSGTHEASCYQGSDPFLTANCAALQTDFLAPVRLTSVKPDAEG